MKILWLCSWYPHSSNTFDGDFIERHAKAIAQHQPIEVIHILQNTNLLTTEPFRTEERTEENLTVKTFYLPFPTTPFEQLSKLIFNQRYYTTMLRALKEYMLQNGKPDLVHVHVPVKAGVGALWFNRKWKVPFIVTEHSNIYHNTGKENFYTNSAYFRFVTKKILSKAIALITVSDFLGKAINEIACKKEYTVIPNVVDTSLFFYPLNKMANERFRFLHVSNLYPVKNPNKMVQAIALYLKKRKDAEFVFIGNKDNALYKAAQELNIPDENIRFMGEIPYKEVALEMKQADAFFLFSKSETFSCVTAEALCCGLPVIASNVGALPELINDENGILVEADNTEALAKAFDELQLNHSQYNSKTISHEASAKFKYEIIAAKILSVYSIVHGKA